MKIAPPISPIAVDQCMFGLGGVGHWAYDIAGRSNVASVAEIREVKLEVINDDVYQLGSRTKRGDVWVDVGSHVGLFSIAAMMAGADVSTMYDMDGEMAWCAEYNAHQFVRQQLVRDYRQRVRPVAFAERVSGHEQLVEAGMLTKTIWDKIATRSCLKLDIQGGEADVLGGIGATALTEAFDFMVLEWHDIPTAPAFLAHLEDSGWRIDGYAGGHTDVLLDTETCIVWASNG